MSFSILFEYSYRMIFYLLYFQHETHSEGVDVAFVGLAKERQRGQLHENAEEGEVDVETDIHLVGTDIAAEVVAHRTNIRAKIAVFHACVTA